MKKNLIQFEAPLGRDDGSQAVNVLCLANENRFTAGNYNEPLTTYAVGWREPTNILDTLNRVAPAVPVGRRFEFKSAVNAQEFLSETDDVRAIGSGFNRVSYSGTSVNQKTINKGLTVRLDRDEDLVNADSEKRAVARLLNRLLRNDLRRAVALLVAAATNTAKTWDTTAGKDPDQDVRADLITGGDARGFGSNTAVYGDTAWLKRSLSHRAQNTAGGIASSSLTPEGLASLLGLDNVIVSKERYQSSASAKSQIVSNLVIMYYASQMVDKDDPSNIKRFVTPTESGDYRVYREEHDKYVDISVEHYSNIVITSTLGIRTLTIS